MKRNSKCRAVMRDQDHRTKPATSVNVSKIRRQMRWCGKMSDREMLKHSTCRDLMGDQHEKATSHHKTASRHATTRRHTKTQDRTTKRHHRR